MTSVRAAKSKGSQFEYDCQYSLSKKYPDIYRTAERGFQRQYDLECKYAIFECKRLKGISWNQLVKFYEKLKSVNINEAKQCYLLFQSNRQPCLVFQKYGTDYQIVLFEDKFMTKFEKHPSTRVKKIK